jgi:hypothetical protein
VKGKRRKTRCLVPAASMEGLAPTVSFQYQIFEDEILRRLRAIDYAKMLGGKPVGEAGALRTQKAAVEQQMEKIAEQLADETNRDVPPLALAAKMLTDKWEALKRALAEAELKEADPQGAAWTEMHTLLDVARKLDEAGRLRLRSLLRTTIREIWVLVVPRSGFRLCWAQLDFTEGGHRAYLIKHIPAGCGREGDVIPYSLTAAEHPAVAKLDLRSRLDAAALEKVLASLDLA